MYTHIHIHLSLGGSGARASIETPRRFTADSGSCGIALMYVCMVSLSILIT